MDENTFGPPEVPRPKSALEGGVAGGFGGAARDDPVTSRKMQSTQGNILRASMAFPPDKGTPNPHAYSDSHLIVYLISLDE